MNQPLVSLIVPVYNSVPYLDVCLDGVAKQTYPNIEVVIVDDGSTDGSGELCDVWNSRYPDWKVLHKLNEGVASARNDGLDNCNGEFIAFIDSDDVISPDYIMNLWLLLESSAGADISMTSFVRASKLPEWHMDEEKRSYGRDDVINAMLYQTGHIDNGVYCKLFRARLFDDVRFVDGIIYEDLELMTRILQKCHHVVKSDTIDYFYRINPKSLTGKDNFNLCRLDVLDVTKKIYQDAEAFNRPWANAARDRYFSASCNMLALLGVNGMGRSTHADGCWETVKLIRYRSLTDPHTRLKSKLGALVSYFGRSVFGLISSFTV